MDVLHARFWNSYDSEPTTKVILDIEIVRMYSTADL